MSTQLGPDRRAAAHAAKHDGVLTLAEALACGLTADQVKRRLENGRWEQLVRGVYALAGTPDTWRRRARAAQLAVGRAGGVTSYATSRALHELGAPSMLPHVTVPTGRSPRCPIAKVHRADLDPIDLATVDGIRTTSVSRLLVDMASALDRPSLEELVDDALLGGRASPESALRALARAGGHRRGRLLLTSVLDVWTEAIEPGSQAEIRLLRRLAEWGIPEPVTQHELRAPDGERVARLDLAWPDHLAGVEYEGVRHHGPRRIDPDERRYERIRRLGWRVTGADKRDLLPGEHRLTDLLLRWVGRAGAA